MVQGSPPQRSPPPRGGGSTRQRFPRRLSDAEQWEIRHSWQALADASRVSLYYTNDDHTNSNSSTSSSSSSDAVVLSLVDIQTLCLALGYAFAVVVSPKQSPAKQQAQPQQQTYDDRVTVTGLKQRAQALSLELVTLTLPNGQAHLGLRLAQGFQLLASMCRVADEQAAAAWARAPEWRRAAGLTAVSGTTRRNSSTNTAFGVLDRGDKGVLTWHDLYQAAADVNLTSLVTPEIAQRLVQYYGNPSNNNNNEGGAISQTYPWEEHSHASEGEDSATTAAAAAGVLYPDEFRAILSPVADVVGNQQQTTETTVPNDEGSM